MGVDENYDDNIERQATHPSMLPQEAQECKISDENRELLRKAGAIRTLMAATKTSIPKATRNTQAAVAALLLLKIDGEKNSRVIIPSQECVGRQGMHPVHGR